MCLSTSRSCTAATESTELAAAVAAPLPLPGAEEQEAAKTAAATAAAPWRLRPTSLNDRTLREAFTTVLRASATLDPADRLIMYDACDDGEVSEPLGPGLRKRLDPRRNTKPKKPDAQRFVCTPFNPDGFHFGKIRNPGERLLSLPLQGATYHVLTNKFPLFPKHMLLVADALVPQQMSAAHLGAISELLQATSFCAYFNSWCASASVNHFHCHVIDEFPPVTSLPLVPGPLVDGVRALQPQGFPGFCYVFTAGPAHAAVVASLVRAMQADNQPHNLLLTPRHVYVWPKPLERPARSFELYPETVGGPELLGSFTVYQQDDFSHLTTADCLELFRINTAPLPSRYLHREAGAGRGLDDAAVPAPASVPHELPASADDAAGEGVAPAPTPVTIARSQKKIPMSKSVDLHALRLGPAAGAWRGRRRDAGGGL